MQTLANRLSLFLGSIVCVMAPVGAARGQPTSAPAPQPAAMNSPNTRPATPAWPSGKPSAPAALPGSGLVQHDFFYAGEAKTRDMYIVRKGEIVWAYRDSTGRGEISDATLLSNGNILFAHQFGVTLINPDKKVLWNFDAPPNTEIHAAQAITRSSARPAPAFSA